MKQREAHELLKKWQEEGDVSSRNKVVLAHLGLVDWWVGKYNIPAWCSLTVDDAKQIATEAVIIACDSYKIDHPSANFYACAVGYVRRNLFRAIQERGASKGTKEAESSMLSIHPSEESDELDVPSDAACQYGWTSLEPKDFVEDIVITGLADRVRHAAREVLSERELAVYKLHYEHGFTYERSGSELGITRQGAARIGQEIRRKIKRRLEGEF